MIAQGDTVAVRQILRMGNPILRERSRELTKEEILSDWFTLLITDMTDSMHATQGIGIAAPQIGELVTPALTHGFLATSKATRQNRVICMDSPGQHSRRRLFRAG